MLCGVGKVHDVCNDEGDGACEKYLLVHAEMVCHGASHKNSGADTDVPAAEVSAVCCAALVVAGEIHAHGLVAGEDESEACADKECCKEKCDWSVAKCEHDVSNNVERHAGTDKVDEVAAVDKAASHDAVEDESCRDEGVKPAGTADAEFLGVKRDVIGDGAVGESDENEVCKLRNGSREEKSVERKWGMGLFLFAGNAQSLDENESDDAQDNRNGEDNVVAEGFVKEHACHGTCGEREIHANAEVADAFASAT